MKVKLANGLPWEVSESVGQGLVNAGYAKPAPASAGSKSSKQTKKD